MFDPVRIGDRREIINRGAMRGHEYRRAADGSVCLVLVFEGGSMQAIGGDLGPYVKALRLPDPPTDASALEPLDGLTWAEPRKWSLSGDAAARFRAAVETIESEAAEELWGTFYRMAGPGR